MPVERINPPTMRPPGGLTNVVRVGDTVYISGQVALESSGSVVGVGDVDTQADKVYSYIGAGLEAVGGSFDNLVKVTAYVPRPEYYRAVVDARKRYLGPKPAASTTVIVPALAQPNLLIEVEAIAVVGKTATSREAINPPRMHEPEHHSMLVKAGNVVYICGLCAWDPDGNIVGPADAASQATQLYANLDICLQAAGATREDVVKTTTFLTHPFYLAGMRTARDSFYGPNSPTSAAIIVSHLANPRAVLEIESIAVIGEEKRYLNPEDQSKPVGFTKVITVGNMAYVAGLVGNDRSGTIIGVGDPDAQIAQLYSNLEGAVRAVGGTRFSIAKTNTYFTNPAYFTSVRKAREEFYRDSPPTSTAVPVAGLVHPDMLAEIEAVALIE